MKPATNESVKPLAKPATQLRQRMGIRGELTLALLPTAMILAVLLLVEVLSRQRLLFASLASSAFLIYLDPRHPTNSIRSLALSHLAASLAGAASCSLIGEGYAAAAIAMVTTIVVMISLDAVHPPAVATALGFAFRAENTSGMLLFVLALVIICLLVVLQRSLLWMLTRLTGLRR